MGMGYLQYFSKIKDERNYSMVKGIGRVGPKSNLFRLATNVRFGSKADMCGALTHVRYGPKADMASLFDHLIGAALHLLRHGNAEYLGRLGATPLRYAPIGFTLIELCPNIVHLPPSRRAS